MAERIEFRGVAETVRRLRGLPKELAGFRGGPVRKALFESAGVMLREARAIAPEDLGILRKGLFRRRNTNPKREEGAPVELYHVGWDTKKVPHGHIVELGSSKWAGKSFMRPTFEGKKDEAAAVYADVLEKEVNKIERKLASNLPR